MIALEPLGDRGFLARFVSELEAARWTEALRASRSAGVVDVVLAYETAAVFADPEHVDLAALEARLRALKPGSSDRPVGKSVRVPVLYDGEDLSEVARKLGLSMSETIALHHKEEYRVFAIGFLPGFPYLGYLTPALSGLARRDSPRLRVPRGSVAIAGRQTAVYPSVSPGGWHLIGRTPLQIADIESGYFPIQAGDRVRFEPIDVTEYAARQDERL